MSFTYRELLAYLLTLTEDQLNGEVSYRISAGEYYYVRGIDDGESVEREFDMLEVPKRTP